MSAIPEAASVLLARGPGSAEVFLVARAPALRFMGGFHAFPGGKVHPEDAGLADAATGLTACHVAAARELFEETGVLLARRADGSSPPGDGLSPAREGLLAERLGFRDLLAELGLHLDARDLTPAGALVTPAFSAVRFHTTFFVATLPPGQEPTVWPGELTEGAWASADAALAAWGAGAYLLSPPTVSLLEELRGRPIEDLPDRFRNHLAPLAAGALPPIWFNPGLLMAPLRCAGLPGTPYTNAFLVGAGPTYLLDPGPADAAEQAVLFGLLDGLGRRPDAVVLTHHHPDHVGAASACARRYSAPVLAHAATAERLAGQVEVGRLLADGDRLDLGEAPHGRGRWHLEAVHTPGHAAGHLAFYEPWYRLLFAGDMVSTASSVLIAPPEGDLGVYLQSLRRLQGLPARLLLPAHGPPSARPAFVLEGALAHRAQREAELVGLLAAGPREVGELAREAYRGLPATLMRLAELQVLAGLQKLRREGRAAEEEGRWRGI